MGGVLEVLDFLKQIGFRKNSQINQNNVCSYWLFDPVVPSFCQLTFVSLYGKNNGSYLNNVDLYSKR